MEITIESVGRDRAAITTGGTALAALAESGWDDPVPTCPGWSVGTLVAHTGAAHRWATANLRATERVRFSKLSPPPEGREDLLGWYAAGLDDLVSTAATTDAEKVVWTFAASGERRAAWWLRRMAQETAVHGWDAALAPASAAGLPAGSRPAALDADLAAAGIDEYLVDFLPRLPADAFAGWKGTLHLHATDAAGEWVLDLADISIPVRREHAKADTGLRGPSSDLLLWLWNRQSAAGLEVHGDAGVVDRWQGIRI